MRLFSVRRFLLALALFLSLAIPRWMAFTANAAPALQVIPTKPAVRNEITFPRPGTVVYGYMRIQGTALINDYMQYQVHISPANADQWSWLTTSYNVVRDGNLHGFDTTQLADGFYDIRVRAIQRGGDYSETFVRGFEIRNENPPTPTATPNITATTTITVTGPAILPPLSPLETPSPLATPTPTPESFIPGGQGLYSPRRAETLQGAVRIVGTANGRDPQHRFLRYELYISPSGQETWRWLLSSTDQMYNDTLYVLDTTLLENGFYDLRMRLVYADANYDQYHVRNLNVQNDASISSAITPYIRLTAPQDGSTVFGIVDVTGTIVHPRLQRWEIYWRRADTLASEWLFLYRGSYPVIQDVIARLDLGAVSPGLYELRLRVVRQDGNYTDSYIRRLTVARPTP